MISRHNKIHKDHHSCPKTNQCFVRARGVSFQKRRASRNSYAKRGSKGGRSTFAANSTELLPWGFPGGSPPCLSRPCGASPVALRWSPGSDFSFLKRDPHGSRLDAHGNLNFGHRGVSCKYRYLARLEACFRFILDSSEFRYSWKISAQTTDLIMAKGLIRCHNGELS
jgi:hypothetical protein